MLNDNLEASANILKISAQHFKKQRLPKFPSSAQRQSEKPALNDNLLKKKTRKKNETENLENYEKRPFAHSPDWVSDSPHLGCPGSGNAGQPGTKERERESNEK